MISFGDKVVCYDVIVICDFGGGVFSLEVLVLVCVLCKLFYFC